MLRQEQFHRFLEIVPTFETILSTSQVALTTINRMNKEKADIFDMDDEDIEAEFKHTAESSQALPEIVHQGSIVTGGVLVQEWPVVTPPRQRIVYTA